MKRETRKAVTYWHRIARCQVCKFPLSHRHHLLGFKAFGEYGPVAHLCGSCHDVLHVMDNAICKGRRGVLKLLDWLKKRVEDWRLDAIEKLVRKAKRLRRKAERAAIKAVESGAV